MHEGAYKLEPSKTPFLASSIEFHGDVVERKFVMGYDASMVDPYRGYLPAPKEDPIAHLTEMRVIPHQ